MLISSRADTIGSSIIFPAMKGANDVGAPEKVITLNQAKEYMI